MKAVRERVLKAVAVGVVLAAAGSLVLCEHLQSRREQQFADLLTSLQQKYGVGVLHEQQAYPVKCRGYEIHACNPSRREVLAYVDTLRELMLYPQGLVRVSGVRTVVLGKAIVFEDANCKQPRTAVPVFERNTLYLDVTTGRWSPIYQAQALHHEFFHFVDLRDDGRLYRDDEWAQLNDASFTYGRGGSRAQVAGAGMLIDEFPGFLTRYARSGVEEDKAETFAWLMIDPDGVAARATRHVVLQRKVDRLKELLVRTAPDVNVAWWDEIHALRRDGTPW